MIDARIVEILQHYNNGLSIREISDKLLPETYDYNTISIICHNMVNRGLLLKERNEQDIFVYRLADRSHIRTPPPTKDSNVKVSTVIDKE